MNIVILVAIMIQWFVSSKSRLWGSIISLLITVGIAIWGAIIYLAGYTMQFFGFTLSAPIFFLLILAWVGYDIYLLVQVVKAGNKSVAIKVSEETKVFAKTDPNSPVVRTLMKGDEVMIRTQGKTVKGVKWIEIVNSASSRKEYILSTVSVLREFVLMQDEVYLYARPDRGSEVIERMEKNGRGEILKTINGPEGDWVKVSTPITVEGYMHGDTKVKLNNQ